MRRVAQKGGESGGPVLNCGRAERFVARHGQRGKHLPKHFEKVGRRLFAPVGTELVGQHIQALRGHGKRIVSIQAFPENAVVRRRFQLEPGVEQAAAVDVTQQTAFGQVLRELAFVHAQHEHDAGIDGANTVDAADEHFVERCGDPADVKGGKGAEE